VDLSALSDSHRRVYEAVADGAARPSEIETRVGLSHRRVADILSELVDAGYLIKPQYGRYQRAA
jgi:predicted transcriptional regulator